jgi:thiol:disulfide interchange protein DsbD
LLGAYQIIVPSAILNKVQPTGKQGIGVPLAMGFASTLTSFTCTAPFVGTMLFSAAAGNVVRPALGMLVYSLAFASPFFLLAFFPSWLSKMPRAGEWLIAVKATMGFVELAAAIKFLQQADYTWQLGWLTRAGMLTVWFSISVVTALYLFRTIRLPHDSEGTKVGPTRRAIGAVFAALAIWFLMGSNGRDLGYFESYLPEASYGQGSIAPTAWLEDDYAEALKRSKEENKPLLINFTGYACTNCRLMEKHVLPEKVVTSELGNFVPVFLHTDGTDAKSHQNAELQQKLLGTVALPVYAVISPEGTLKGRLDGLERDPEKFAAFLRESHAAMRLASR